MSSWILLVLSGAFIVNTFLFSACVLLYAKHQRKGRPPHGKDVKLLRGPGQHLQEEIGVMEESLVERYFTSVGAPVLILVVPLCLLPFAKGNENLVLALTVAGFVISFVYRLRQMGGLLKKLACYRLGLQGERCVAESLQPLMARGFAVFHDMPVQGKTGMFNLDHVVVGSSGVFVVETKTRRKVKQDANGDDHKVESDGKTLRWPGGSGSEEIRQAADNASWLKQFILSRLGLSVDVAPVLVIPGWYVNRTGSGQVRVLNEKEIERAILGRPVLDEKAVDQIRRLVDAECRTVGFGS